VEIMWKRGEDPRFEMVDVTGQVLKGTSLARKTVDDIEGMLATYGYEPKNKGR